MLTKTTTVYKRKHSIGKQKYSNISLCTQYVYNTHVKKLTIKTNYWLSDYCLPPFLSHNL